MRTSISNQCKRWAEVDARGERSDAVRFQVALAATAKTITFNTPVLHLFEPPLLRRDYSDNTLVAAGFAASISILITSTRPTQAACVPDLCSAKDSSPHHSSLHLQHHDTAPHLHNHEQDTIWPSRRRIIAVYHCQTGSLIKTGRFEKKHTKRRQKSSIMHNQRQTQSYGSSYRILDYGKLLSRTQTSRRIKKLWCRYVPFCRFLGRKVAQGKTMAL